VTLSKKNHLYSNVNIWKFTLFNKRKTICIFLIWASVGEEGYVKKDWIFIHRTGKVKPPEVRQINDVYFVNKRWVGEKRKK